MLGQSIFSYLTIAAPHKPQSHPLPQQDLAANLDHALRRAPFEKRAELQALCHWLVCCKNLWPAATAQRHAGISAPFGLHQQNQSLHADPEYVERTVSCLLGETDADLMQDINRYVLASGHSHWQALLEQNHPAALIDPAGVPRYWPRECLIWAIRTMNMDAADLSFANLGGADLSDVDLCNADLQYAYLDNATLEGADLYHANVEDATFRHANLSDANLTGLTFSTDKNNLDGAIFDGAILDDIGLDIGPYEAGPDGAYALRKGLLPPPLDHMIRDHLRSTRDSDSDSDYLADFTDDDSTDSETGSASDAAPASANSKPATPDEASRAPSWQTALCCSLMLFSVPNFLLKS